MVISRIGYPVLMRDGARAGVMFWLTGVLSATWAARIPSVQDRLGLSPGGLALAVLAVEGGALLGLPLGAALTVRWGVRRSLRLGFACFPTALVAAAIAPNLGWLAAALAVWAAANSVLDVAMNVAGVALERRLARPVLGRLHAGQGLGLLTGALLATVLAARWSLPGHVVLVAGLALVVGVGAVRGLSDPAPAREPARAGRVCPYLGAAAFCAFLLDGSAASWSAVQLRTDHGAPPALAAAGYACLCAAIVLGRIVADPAVNRWGRSRVVRFAGLVALAGTALVMTAPALPVAMAGWTVLGLGLAPLAPALLGGAPANSASSAPVAITSTAMLGYAGSFSGPPLIGALGAHLALSAALAPMPVAALAVAILARRALAR